MNLKTVALLAALLPTAAYGAKPTIFETVVGAKKPTLSEAVRGVVPANGQLLPQGVWKTERDYPRPSSNIRWPDPARMCMQFGCNHPL